MLEPGGITGAGEWAQAGSLARAIEDAMVATELVDLAEDSDDVRIQRRQTLIAIATGIVTHVTARMEVTVHLQPLIDAGMPIPGGVTALPGTVE